MYSVPCTVLARLSSYDLLGGEATTGGGTPISRNLIQEIERKATASKLEKQREAAQQLAATAPARKLALAMKERGWSVGAPQVSIGVLPGTIDCVCACNSFLDITVVMSL